MQWALAKLRSRRKKPDTKTEYKDAGKTTEKKNHAWWDPATCRQENVPDIDTNAAASGDGKLHEEDPGRYWGGDIGLTEPDNVAKLDEELKYYGVDTSKFGQGKVKTLDA